jgi:hypothetical protein
MGSPQKPFVATTACEEPNSTLIAMGDKYCPLRATMKNLKRVEQTQYTIESPKAKAALKRATLSTPLGVPYREAQNLAVE